MKMLRAAVLFILCGSVSYGIPPSAVAEFPCTAVIYLFRHAEDAAPGPDTKTILDGVTYSSKLLPWGDAHAALYNDMITSLGTLFNGTLCPVGKVYAVNPTKPNGQLGSTNPYKTAQPLALLTMDANPIITMGQKRIDEHFGPGGVTPHELRAAYAPILRDGLSVAFFWTSQGLPDLALAINSAFPIPADPKPLRNSVFMYKYFFDFLDPVGAGEPPDPRIKWYDKYRQCFNYNPNRKQGKFSPVDGTNAERPGEFYCSKSGKLPIIPTNDLWQLRGRICDTTSGFHALPSNAFSGYGEYYGYCTSPYYR
jgi:hypothetical protein